MENEDNDILLSAYLDGELTADERQRVEALLATSAEARQLVDELRAIRASLQGLPQHKLGPDFAGEVLRRAELEISTPETPASEISSFKSEVRDPPSPALPVPSSRVHLFNRRGLTWSLIAVAAAVLLVVTNRPADQRQEAAHRSLEQESIAQAPAQKTRAESVNG